MKVPAPPWVKDLVKLALGLGIFAIDLKTLVLLLTLLFTSITISNASFIPIILILGGMKIFRLLIDRGVNVEEKCHIYGGDALYAELSALYLAVMGQHDKVVQLLLGKHADVHATGTVNASRKVQAGLVAPFVASLLGLNLGRVQRSLGRNDEIDLNIEVHPTAMHFAALTDGDVVARSPLDHGAEVDTDCDIYIEAVTKDSIKIDLEGRLMVLHLAACTGQGKMTQLLLVT